ncbi:MAG: alpha/beta hydrolase [Candidatus Lernaella stagnicola]|nr:alpha/beta hydrolase [Candidatus Lernaella stagnicola]
MRSFRISIALLIVLCVASFAWADEEISGTFKITENGKLVGAEKFTITFESDGRVTSSSHGTVRQDKTEAKDYTRLVLRTLDGPIHTYQREVFVSQLPQGLFATYNGDELLIETREGPRKKETRLNITPSTMLVDVGVWHHLHFLIHRYSHRTGGQQRFATVVASELRIADPVYVKQIGREAVSLENGYFMANKYFVNRGDVGIIVWADTKGRILRIESPMQGYAAELAKYDGERAPEVQPVRTLGENVLNEAVNLDSQTEQLGGLLTKPRGIEARLPALIFLSDAGPHDRDGNSLSGNVNVRTGEWLDRISESGFAVLRLDDRGVGESAGDFARNSLSVQALDATAQIEFLKKRDDIDPDRIGIIGHGEGANVAIMVAAKRPDVKAVVLLSPSDVPLSDLAVEQIKHRIKIENRPQAGSWERHPVISLMRIAREQPDREFFVYGGHSVYLDVYREWFGMTPIEDLKKSSARILHIHPDKDLQVFPQHADAFVAAFKGTDRYTFKGFKGLNHFFLPSEGTIGEYADPSLEVEQSFVDYVIGWMKATL